MMSQRLGPSCTRILVLALILTCTPSEQSAQVKRVVDDGVPVPRAESQDSMAPDVRRIRNPGLSVARLWDEQLLDAIRIDIPKPPAHARNLFHLSVAMWDAWAAYAPAAVGYVVEEKHTAMDIEAARA